MMKYFFWWALFVWFLLSWCAWRTEDVPIDRVGEEFMPTYHIEALQTAPTLTYATIKTPYKKAKVRIGTDLYAVRNQEKPCQVIVWDSDWADNVMAECSGDIYDHILYVSGWNLTMRYSGLRGIDDPLYILSPSVQPTPLYSMDSSWCLTVDGESLGDHYPCISLIVSSEEEIRSIQDNVLVRAQWWYDQWKSIVHGYDNRYAMMYMTDDGVRMVSYYIFKKWEAYYYHINIPESLLGVSDYFFFGIQPTDYQPFKIHNESKRYY